MLACLCVGSRSRVRAHTHIRCFDRASDDRKGFSRITNKAHGADSFGVTEGGSAEERDDHHHRVRDDTDWRKNRELNSRFIDFKCTFQKNQHIV